MAVFPCDWTGHRYPGPQRSAYIVSAYGEDVETSKLRLCERHFDEMLDTCRTHLALIDEDSRVDQHCTICGEDKQFAIYVKLFQLKADPDYWATDVCAKCWQSLRTDLHVASGSTMRSA